MVIWMDSSGLSLVFIIHCTLFFSINLCEWILILVPITVGYLKLTFVDNSNGTGEDGGG